LEITEYGALQAAKMNNDGISKPAGPDPWAVDPDLVSI
jgi:hypothetical protein